MWSKCWAALRTYSNKNRANKNLGNTMSTYRALTCFWPPRRCLWHIFCLMGRKIGQWLSIQINRPFPPDKSIPIIEPLMQGSQGGVERNQKRVSVRYVNICCIHAFFSFELLITVTNLYSGEGTGTTKKVFVLA